MCRLCKYDTCWCTAFTSNCTHLRAGGVRQHVLAVGVTDAVHVGHHLAGGVQHLWAGQKRNI